jgi:flagellar protein FliL
MKYIPLIILGIKYFKNYCHFGLSLAIVFGKKEQVLIEEITMAKEEKGAEAKAKPKKKPMLLFALIGVGALLLLGGGGFFAWKIFMAPKSNTPTDNAHGGGAAKNGHGGSEAKEGEKGGGEGGATIILEPFLVNLADQDANRYLKASIRILVANAEVAKKASENEVLMPRLRDSILNILSTKVANEIISNEGKQKLKKEILEKINEFIPEKAAKEIFFTDFVVQL